MKKQLLLGILNILTVFSLVAQSEKPNILFIAIDDMNDWTGFLGGHPQAITPHMDDLAKKGVNFTNAHCSAPGCSPSRNSLLFGKEPFNSGLYPFYDGPEKNMQLVNEFTTLPELMKGNGYNTFGAGKIHHGQKEHPESEWTDFGEIRHGKMQFNFDKGIKGKSGKYNMAPTTHAFDEHHDYKVASYGIDILSKKHDKPFFLAVGIVKPHLAFVCPEQFFDALPEEIDPPAIKGDDMDDISWAGRDMLRLGEASSFAKKKQWSAVRKAYLACISWADYNVGRVVDALEKSEYAKNTIVILWSDHGFHLGEKNTFKKFTLWEEATRVPFIIHDMRETEAKEGREIKDAVSLVNIYKTIADYAGIKVPEGTDGFTLRPHIEDVAKPLPGPAITSWGRGNYAIRDKDWRYIRYFDGSEELYSHQRDPNEWTNLASNPEFQSVKERLATYLPKNEAPTRPNYAVWSLVGADKVDPNFKKLKANWKKVSKGFNPPLPK